MKFNLALAHYYLFSLGSWSEFVLCPEESVALKPPSISFEDAASIPLAAMTALQALKKFGDISGKTVLVPAGCMRPFFFGVFTNIMSSLSSNQSENKNIKNIKKIKKLTIIVQ